MLSKQSIVLCYIGELIKIMIFVNFNIPTKRASTLQNKNIWQKLLFLTHCYQYVETPSSKIKWGPKKE